VPSFSRYTTFNSRNEEMQMAAYGKKASDRVGDAMHEMKRGDLKSGGSGKTVKSRKQAIAIGLSEARREGGKVPAKKTGAKKTAAKKTGAKTTAGKKTAAKKTASRTTPARKSAAKKVPTRKTPARKTAAKKRT
jgi:hypothetical protein